MWESRQVMWRLVLLVWGSFLIQFNNAEFEQDTYSASIQENAPSGELIVRVQAINPDPEQRTPMQYYFTEATEVSYGHLFGIHNATGQIHVRGPELDYEEKTFYPLVVVATVYGYPSYSATATVFIKILDINDNSPKIFIQTLSGVMGDVAEITENLPFGSVVYQVDVVDEDAGVNGRVSCSLNNPTFELLKLHDTKYQIVTVEFIDREKVDSYTIELRCEDQAEPSSARLFSVKTLKIIIQDVNDNPPMFSQLTYHGSLAGKNEKGAAILQVTATDLDEGPYALVEYSIHGRYSKTFDINDRGLITLVEPVEIDKYTEYVFSVFAANLGQPELRRSALVIISYDLQASSTNIDEDDYPVPDHCGRTKYSSQPLERGSRARSRSLKMDKRILGGTTSVKGEWPWIVSVQVPGYNRTDYRHNCGGSLIAPQWVLSAAHCFKGNLNGTYKVVVGEHNLYEGENTELVLNVDRVIMHPDIKMDTFVNDIALLKLDQKVQLNKEVNIVCLPAKDEEIPRRTPTITSGWGTTEEDGGVSQYLRHVSVPIIDRKTCYNQYQKISSPVSEYLSTCDPSYKMLVAEGSDIEVVVLFDIVENTEMSNYTYNFGKSCKLIGIKDADFSLVVFDDDICAVINESCQMVMVSRNITESMEITDDMLCAGWSEGARDSCQGDSGGPLVFYNREIKGWQLAGVVSFSIGCGREGFSGVYAKVSKFIPWIEQTIADNS